MSEILKSGEKARLIPVVADTSKEQRAVSVLLAVMSKVPEFANRLLTTIGQRVGQRARVEVYTEVVLAKQGGKDRPDGLIEVHVGKRIFRALVEAKIGKAILQEDQVKKYLEIARENGVDALVTISNEFVARADHHPISVPKTLTRKTGLFHWSWMSLRTQAKLIEFDKAVEDVEQAYLLEELVRFLEHPATGVESFTQMPKEWRDCVRVVQEGGTLKKTSDEVEAVVSAWQQETRDLSFLLARHVGRHVLLKLERKFQNDPASWLKAGNERLAKERRLVCTLQVPDAASDIDIEADLMRRALSCSVRLLAPKDKKSATARINWLVRQLAKADGDQLLIRAIWPSRAHNTMERLSVVRENPDALIGDNASLTPTAFDVVMTRDAVGRFNGSRTMIEELEDLVPAFFDEAVQYLRAWQAPPPKPVHKKEEGKEDTAGDSLAPSETVAS